MLCGGARHSLASPGVYKEINSKQIMWREFSSINDEQTRKKPAPKIDNQWLPLEPVIPTLSYTIQESMVESRTITRPWFSIPAYIYLLSLSTSLSTCSPMVMGAPSHIQSISAYSGASGILLQLVDSEAPKDREIDACILNYLLWVRPIARLYTACPCSYSPTCSPQLYS